MFRLKTLLAFSILCVLFNGTPAGIEGMFDIRYWKCLLKKSYSCPDNNIKFYLYTPEDPHVRKRIDVRSNIALSAAGWNPDLNNVILIHGFNGTHKSPPLVLLRKAYLLRQDYNVFMVHWHELAQFPCYLSALSNLRLVARCTAQLYAYIMDLGGSAKKTTCVGHSLGAHVCGMMSNYLDVKQFKIVGLDPARPLIGKFATREYKLSAEDAYHVQIIHTNAGALGVAESSGHVNFCVNGGAMQPGCKGHIIHRSRCSHFQSACYYAQAVKNNKMFYGIPCSEECPKKTVWNLKPGKSIPMGPDIPLLARGQYCVKVEHNNDCVFQ
ncbi:hypothetical protein RN001_011415 [Aquatica leii]|uniref:Lipase domain-containing protein n=1 Tax=Aquatica leii TaxID=1421715 RepID=A0AAN7SM04_9COLE|nr:hypothetical protein RN001_011415 [Aquatica leii]